MRIAGPLRRIAAAALLAAGSIAVFAILLETVVRLLRLSPQTASFYQPDPLLGARLVPGARGIWRTPGSEAEVVVNSQGFRDVEHSMAKPEGVYRVAFLGDSFVEAMQVPLDRTFFRLFQEAWNRRTPTTPVESLAFGISGFGTAQEYLLWRHFAAPYRPDLVVLVFLPGNDIRNNVFELEQDADRPYLVPDGETLRTVWPPGGARAPGLWRLFVQRAFFPQSLAWLRHRWRALSCRFSPPPAPTTSTGPLPAHWERGWSVTEAAVRLLARETAAAGCRLLVLVIDEGSGWSSSSAPADPPGGEPEEAARRMHELCAGEGIDVLGLYPIFRRAHEERPRLFHVPGDLHWNEDGHQVVARALADRLETLAEWREGGR